MRSLLDSFAMQKLKQAFKLLVLASPLLLLSHVFHHNHGHHHIAHSGYIVPNVGLELTTPDFWILQIPDAKKTLTPPKKIEITPPSSVIDSLKKDIEDLETKKLFDRNRNPVTEKDFEQFLTLQNRDEISETAQRRYAILIRDSDMRILPTHEVLTQEPGDLEFDELQYSRAKAFDVVEMLHQSEDGGWFYVEARDGRAWIPVEDVAFIPDRDTAMGLSNPKPFLMVLADRVTIYSDPLFKIPFAQARMGTRLELKDAENTSTNYFIVSIPIKGKWGYAETAQTYVKRNSDVHAGHLPFSRENILRQAFRLLGKPYGWGGLYDGRDCSSFLQDVFATMGVELPRNSKDQAKVGHIIPSLDDAPPALSFLKLDGHIMLYLGKVNGRHYAIHDSSGYRKPGLFKDKVMKLNQVVVTDLELGKGTRKKSLMERLVSVNVIA